MVEVDAIIIRNVPSLYLFYLVTPAARKWVNKNVNEDREMVGNVLKVERKFGWDIAYGMDCDGLRVTSNVKAVLPGTLRSTRGLARCRSLNYAF